MNRQNKFSILLIGTQMATGGAQKVLFDQARWFQKRGHVVAVAFFYDKEDLHKIWQKGVDFPIYNLNAKIRGNESWKKYFGAVPALWHLWLLFKRQKFDVVETFTHDSNLLVLPLAWLARIPVRLATHHGVIENFPLWLERIHAWLINSGLANGLVAVSTKTYQIAIDEGIDPRRITMIKNGIAPLSLERIDRREVRAEFDLQENDIFLLSVGRLVRQKAHEILISAMPQILKRHPNVKLGICGDGVLRTKLETQIENLRLASSVKLLGRWDNVSRFLIAADIFVLPSRWEGLPIALLEAMSAGLPVVATNVEGVDEVIVERESGFLVPVENSQLLAEAILKLIDDPRLLIDMGKAAQAQVFENYTEERMCEQYLALMLKYRANRD
ncbi:MAG: glycosyltransferase [Anaerolineales bacterium]|nr:glycosyltransferase [Anaerolineales bacterium]MCZ2122741.1 glycosyltransferase [Anaerolineales bacterium]